MKNSKGQFLRHYSINNEFLFKTITPESAWLLGMLSSDGNITNNVVRISQSDECGINRIHKIRDIFKCDNPITVYNPPKGASVYTLGISSNIIVNDLKLYNVVPNKTLSYEYPSNLPDDMIPFFIEGYIEGDGTIGIYKYNDNIQRLTALVVGTKSFIETINTKCVVSGRVRKIPNQKIYELRWTGKKAIKICNWIYANPIFKESKKYKKYIEYIETIHNNDIIYEKYDKLKKEARKLLNTGYSIKDIAIQLNMHFQLLYKWKKAGVFEK
jgi:hypothetical protein